MCRFHPGCRRSHTNTGAGYALSTGCSPVMCHQPMSRDGIWRICKVAKEKAGIDEPGGIHTLHHCYATGLLEARVELHVIQRHLGHSSIRSTKRNLHLAHDKTSATSVAPGSAGVPASRSGLTGGPCRPHGAGDTAGAGGRGHPARARRCLWREPSVPGPAGQGCTRRMAHKCRKP